MVVSRGDIWWADLGLPLGSEPGFRRPVLVIQNNAFNRSRISTIVAIVLTSNLRRLEAPGNVLIPSRVGGLSRDSVANVSQIITLDRSELTQRVGSLSADVMRAVDLGLKLVLDL